ncbi:MAG: PilZ domain-containing protein [Desulfobulbia bacterium]
MVPNLEKRKRVRISHACPVTIEDLDVGLIYEAQMLNYSENGLYFEADKLLRPGEGIFIGIENSPVESLADTYECYRARIIWRKKLTTSVFYYGYGARYTVNYNKLKLQLNTVKEWEDIRRHKRKPYSRPVFLATENRVFEGFAQNISRAGVFIKTNENIAAGQIVTLGIPLRKKKRAKVKGRVVWSNLEGFGIKFLGRKKK